MAMRVPRSWRRVHLESSPTLPGQPVAWATPLSAMNPMRAGNASWPLRVRAPTRAVTSKEVPMPVSNSRRQVRRRPTPAEMNWPTM